MTRCSSIFWSNDEHVITRNRCNTFSLKFVVRNILFSSVSLPGDRVKCNRDQSVLSVALPQEDSLAYGMLFSCSGVANVVQVREAAELWQALRVEFLERTLLSRQANLLTSSRLMLSFQTKIKKMITPCRVFVRSVRYQMNAGLLLQSHDAISIDQLIPITMNSFRYRLNLDQTHQYFQTEHRGCILKCRVHARISRSDTCTRLKKLYARTRVSKIVRALWHTCIHIESRVYMRACDSHLGNVHDYNETEVFVARKEPALRRYDNKSRHGKKLRFARSMRRSENNFLAAGGQ